MSRGFSLQSCLEKWKLLLKAGFRRLSPGHRQVAHPTLKGPSERSNLAESRLRVWLSQTPFQK